MSTKSLVRRGGSVSKKKLGEHYNAKGERTKKRSSDTLLVVRFPYLFTNRFELEEPTSVGQKIQII